MKKEVIFEIFSFLKSKGITATESEFSEHWLGCSESYVRKLRSARTEQRHCNSSQGKAVVETAVNGGFV